MVVSHPIRALAVITVALVPLAIIGLQVTPNYNTTGELSRKSQSVLGLQAIQEHFTPGELGPVIVLLESNKPWDNQEGKRLLSHLSQGFQRLSGVAEVRSLTQPLGQPVKEPKGINEDAQGILKKFWSNVLAGVDDQIMRVAREYYLATLVNREGREKNKLK